MSNFTSVYFVIWKFMEDLYTVFMLNNFNCTVSVVIDINVNIY